MNILNNLLYRKFPGNNCKYIKVFHLHTNSNKLTLSLPIKNDTESVMIASLNDYATSQIIKSFPECSVEDEQLFLVNHKAEIMRMSLVTVVNVFCSLDTKQEVFEVHYFSPPKMPLTEYSNLLIEQEDELLF
jgi:hypothetical protein